MKFAFLTNVPRSIGRVRLQQEARDRGHELTILSKHSIEIEPDTIAKLTDEFAVFDLVHFAGGLGEFITRRVQAGLEARCIPCPNNYNNRSTNSDNKIYQALEFMQAGIPTPLTVRGARSEFSELVALLGLPFVAKKPNSTQGKGVSLIRSESDLQMLNIKKEYLFQEYIDYEADYRVHVVGDHTFCSYRRMASDDDFRANVSLGGSMEKINDEKIKEELSVLAVRTAKAMRLDYCGVDIIKNRSGQLYVLETNSDPGYKGVDEVTGESFAKPIIDYYEQLVLRAGR